MYAIGLLIISYQFILAKMKQNAFFLVGISRDKNLPELNPLVPDVY